jgi:hypothetical protein
MKNLLLPIFILVFSRSLKAQTKEETLRWISNKIGWHTTVVIGKFSNSSDRYREEIRYTCYYDTINFSEKDYFPKDYDPRITYETIKADLRNLTNAEICNDCTEVSSAPIILHFRSVLYTSSVNSNTPIPKTIVLYLDWQSEPDLKNRMLKAFQALINYNRPKEAY